MEKNRTLRTYLTDHLAGSRYATQLIERCRELYPEPPLDAFFDELLEEVRRDQAILKSMLLRIGGSGSRAKDAGAWALEQMSRLKHLESSESAGSSLLERLESLSLGISGKRSLWQALDGVSGGTGRFGGLDLADLRSRAERQLDRVEEQRLEAARNAFAARGDREPWEGRDRAEALRGVLLDVDGTLIETNDAHARAWVDAFSDADRPVLFEQVRPLIGMGGDRLIRELTGTDPESDEGRFMADRHTEHFLKRHLDGCEPFDGVRELLQRLRNDGLGLTAATSSSRKEAERVLEAAGVSDLVDRSTSSSDVDRSKPDPEVVETALEASGWEPAEAVLLGDTPFDVEAGERAGVGVVAVRCGGSGDAELAGALAVYDDPADLESRYDTSPFGRRTVGRRG